MYRPRKSDNKQLIIMFHIPVMKVITMSCLSLSMVARTAKSGIFLRCTHNVSPESIFNHLQHILITLIAICVNSLPMIAP